MTRTLINISQDLKRLATGTSEGERALRDVAIKLASANSSDVAGVDLAGAYPPEVMLPEGKSSVRRLASGLELCRDILIFIPVMYTWWKISEALTAYSDYTGDAPFLLAWQQGFGNQTDPLSSSALFVAGVVLAVILLTVVAHQVRGGYDHSVQKRQQKLAVLLGEATLLLGRPPEGAPAGTKSGRPARESKNGNTPQEPSQTPHEVAAQLRATQKALSDMAVRIGEETRRLLAAFESERMLSRQEAHAHHSMAAEVSASTQLLSDSLKGLNENADLFNELVHRMSFVVDRLDGGRGGQNWRAEG